MADRDDPTRSVAGTTSRTKLPSQSTMVMFSTTPEDTKLGIKRSGRLCKILSVVGRKRGNWRLDCTRYGLFVSVPVIPTSQGLLFQVLHSDGQCSAIARFGVS